MHPSPRNTGWIEVICGPMFSGKTEELIRRLNRARIARQKVEIFKPELDNRYDVERVVSHDSNSILSTPVQSASQILFYSHDVNVIGIDEAQFFDDELPSVCNTLANNGIRVVVAGGGNAAFHKSQRWICPPVSRFSLFWKSSKLPKIVPPRVPPRIRGR